MSFARKISRTIKRVHMAKLDIITQEFYDYINQPERHPDSELRQFVSELIAKWNKYCNENNLTDSYKDLLITKIKIKWNLVTKTTK